ncbi:hypothetical protein CAPTEDRAFT_199268 [Capitella teleta]|uniref:Uncharacterized protein n=1 Tax=Capitella teleta TaxID=283909 RepID=R7UBR8_CAPTE|nr:hypothetical protein CAPTEDRAFT_199268 [Capitella teleta]|eukprot:ELU03820.1 hypothetical protein CAPTEDRAFT_199268 [Capitella teleta]
MGAPGTNNLRGGISIVNQDMTVIRRIAGEQVGEYFGYSVAVGNFNQDRYDDIAVGCPMYRLRSRPTHEIGRVCLYYQDSNHNFAARTPKCIEGSTVAGSQFGLAVAAIGDVDQDKFGGVYIFLSGAVTNTSSSVLMPLPKPACYCESRPVIHLIESDLLQFESNFISLDDKRCFHNSKPVTCITMKTCMQPRISLSRTTEFWFEIRTDTLKDNINKKRAFIYNGNDGVMYSVYNSSAKSTVCNVMYVYIDPHDNTRDKLTPVQFEMTYGLLKADTSNMGIAPILSQRSHDKIIKQLQIQRFCGEDNVCFPDLAVSITSQTDSFVFGTEPTIDFNINITNSEEDAYESSFTLFMPRGIQFTRIRKIHGRETPNCGRIKTDEFLPEGFGASMKCEIGNPFPNNEDAGYTLGVQIGDVDEDIAHLKFLLIVNSSNAEHYDTTFNNYAVFNLTAEVEMHLRLTGLSKPEQILVNSTELKRLKTMGQEGPYLQHIYEIKNLGPSSTGLVVTTIELPYVIVGGLNLFNLTSQPSFVSGNGSCSLQMMQPRPEVVMLLASTDPEAPQRQEESKGPMEGMPMLVNCRSANVQLCATIECIIDRIDKADQVQVEINLELITSTLQAIQGDFKNVEVKAEAHSVVMNVPYAVQLAQMLNATTQTTTNLAGPKDSAVALWIIIVAAGCGLLLLIVVTVTLWKCGFFRRQRVADVHGKEAKRAISGLEEEFSWTGGTEKLTKTEQKVEDSDED